MTPEEIFQEVAEDVFVRLHSKLRAVLAPVLREYPGVWEHCEAVAAAVAEGDAEEVSEQLHELDHLVAGCGWDYHFEDLEYRLLEKMKSEEAEPEE